MSFALVIVVAGLLLPACRATAPVAPQASASSPLSALAFSTATFKTFAVYSQQTGLKSHYVPSGYMGDSDITLSVAKLKSPQGENACLKVNYRGTGPKGWTGIYWQDPANNWGERAGRAGYDLRGATRLTFRARGDKGGERVKEFKVGGIVGKYPDSDVAILSNVRLNKEWQRYEIDLKGKDLRHIIGGFGFTLSRSENGGGAIFYLDEILYEGPEVPVSLTPEPGAPIMGQLPSGTTGTTPAPLPPAPKPEMQDLQLKEMETGLKVSFSSRLMFQSGKSVLEQTSGRVLDQLIRLLEAYPKNAVLVEGHTDSLGAKDFNLKLSDLRAKAVRDYLIKHGGYDEARFRVTGYGDTKPMADNKTRAGRSLNRRVEVTILKSSNHDKP